MTKEQIAELRRGAQMYVAQVHEMAVRASSGTEASIYLDATEQPELLLRALDEREALLEALKAVDSAADTGWVADEIEDATRIIQEIARAAIAKAEAE